MSQAIADKKIKIEITYNGLTDKFNVDTSDTCGSLRARAVDKFKITQQPHTFSLYRENGAELDPSVDNKRIEEVGIREGELLVLRPGVVRGGGSK